MLARLPHSGRSIVVAGLLAVAGLIAVPSLSIFARARGGGPTRGTCSTPRGTIYANFVGNNPNVEVTLIACPKIVHAGVIVSPTDRSGASCGTIDTNLIVGTWSGSSFSASGDNVSIVGAIGNHQASGTIAASIIRLQPCSVNMHFIARCDVKGGVCPSSQLAIKKLDLRNIDNRKLHYLSVSAHPYFGGNTRIHGFITVKGRKGDELTSLDLNVIENGARVAVARLAHHASQMLLHKRFGASGVIKISTSQLLFNLPSSQMGGINHTMDGNLTLDAVAESKSGASASKTYGPVAKLVRYIGTNRYGPRDETLGGDDWVLPSVKLVLEHFAAGHCYGDMSKMNGGPFPPHASHGRGQDVDVTFDSPTPCTHGGSINYHSAIDAQKFVTDLNDPIFGHRIWVIYVRFSYSNINPFWTTIRDAPALLDARSACRVLKWDKAHGGHFHWRIDYAGGHGWCQGDPGPAPQP